MNLYHVIITYVSDILTIKKYYPGLKKDLINVDKL